MKDDATQRPCFPSVRHKDEESAKRALWAMKQNGRGKDLTVKPCKECKGFHLKRS